MRGIKTQEKKTNIVDTVAIYFSTVAESLSQTKMTVRNAHTKKFSTDSFVTYDDINFSTKEKMSLLARKSNLYFIRSSMRFT